MIIVFKKFNTSQSLLGQGHSLSQNLKFLENKKNQSKGGNPSRTSKAGKNKNVLKTREMALLFLKLPLGQSPSLVFELFNSLRGRLQSFSQSSSSIILLSQNIRKVERIIILQSCPVIVYQFYIFSRRQGLLKGFTDFISRESRRSLNG